MRWLLLVLVGVLLSTPGAPALALEASEEMELGMTLWLGEGGSGRGVGQVYPRGMGPSAERGWRLLARPWGEGWAAETLCLAPSEHPVVCAWLRGWALQGAGP